MQAAEVDRHLVRVGSLSSESESSSSSSSDSEGESGRRLRSAVVQVMAIMLRHNFLSNVEVTFYVLLLSGS